MYNLYLKTNLLEEKEKYRNTLTKGPFLWWTTFQLYNVFFSHIYLKFQLKYSHAYRTQILFLILNKSTFKLLVFKY